MAGLFRRYLLQREVQVSDSTTRIVVLPRQGALSGIGLRFEITNGATRGAALIQDQINRVEVIANGSEVLFSLEGNELYRWSWAWLKRRPPQVRSEVAAAVQELFLFIPFGRTAGDIPMPFGDEELYLNLANFQTVELRINYTTTIAATAFATGTTTISSILYLWPADSMPSGSRGYVRTTQFRAFTSVASGEDVTEMPRRNKLLDVLVWVRAAAVVPDTNITLAEVREDDGRIIPYTGRYADIAAENQEWLDVDPMEHGIALVQDTDTLDTLVYRLQGITFMPVFVQSDANGILTMTAGVIAGDRVTISASETADAAAATHFTAFAARRPVHWVARGVGLPGAIYIPLWDGVSLGSAYDAPAKPKVTLALTNGAAGATVRASLREWVAG
jgi:hypothetical protein